MLFAHEAYTLSSASGKDFGKEAIEAMMGKMNANIDGETNKKKSILMKCLLTLLTYL